MSSTSHWTDYHATWARLGPPLRPSDEVVARARSLLSEHAGPTLLLGVTPELAGIASDLTAVDRNLGMIRSVWPGDSPTRRAVNADWLALPFEAAQFSASVGDGSLNALAYPDGHARIHAELARVLAPGGRVVVRTFCRPEGAESLAAVAADPLHAAAGGRATFHGFKWRVAMAVAASAGAPNVAVQEIRSAFERAVPDRSELARQTGWGLADIDTIDVYRDSDEVYSFPTRTELLRAVPPVFARSAVVSVGTYELAERCPLLVLDRAR